MKLADTDANVRAGLAWQQGAGIRGALAAYNLAFEDVAAYAEVAADSIVDAPTEEAFRGRVVGAVGAGILLGIELERSGELRR